MCFYGFCSRGPDLTLHAYTIFLLSHYIPPARESVEVVVKTDGGTFFYEYIYEGWWWKAGQQGRSTDVWEIKTNIKCQKITASVLLGIVVTHFWISAEGYLGTQIYVQAWSRCWYYTGGGLGGWVAVWVWSWGLCEDRRLIRIHFIALFGSSLPLLHPRLLLPSSVLSPPSFPQSSNYIDFRSTGERDKKGIKITKI